MGKIYHIFKNYSLYLILLKEIPTTTTITTTTIATTTIATTTITTTTITTTTSNRI